MYVYCYLQTAKRPNNHELNFFFLCVQAKLVTVVLLKTKQNVDFLPYMFQPLMEQSVFNRF